MSLAVLTRGPPNGFYPRANHPGLIPRGWVVPGGRGYEFNLFDEVSNFKGVAGKPQSYHPGLGIGLQGWVLQSKCPRQLYRTISEKL